MIKIFGFNYFYIKKNIYTLYKNVSREILNSHPISVLRKEVSKFNKSLGSIKSTQKKPELINDMMKHPDAFSHIQMATKKERSEKQKANDAKLGFKAESESKTQSR